jgi:hypothetical protein
MSVVSSSKETKMPNTMKIIARTMTTAFSEPEPGRWLTDDSIEVVEGPAWHGRSPERRYVAQRLNGGPCGWGATREAAAAAVRGS